MTLQICLAQLLLSLLASRNQASNLTRNRTTSCCGLSTSLQRSVIEAEIVLIAFQRDNSQHGNLPVSSLCVIGYSIDLFNLYGYSYNTGKEYIALKHEGVSPEG